MGILSFRTIALALAAGYEVYDRKIDVTIVRRRRNNLFEMAICQEVTR